MQYYLADKDHQEGPFSWFQVLDRIENGKSTSTTLVWRQGMEKWTALGESEEFATELKKSRTGSPTSTEPEADKPNRPVVEGKPEDELDDDEINLPPGRTIEEIQLEQRLRVTLAWRRFVARSIDDFWLTLLVGLSIRSVWNGRSDFVQLHLWQITFVCRFLFAWVESGLLALWGTTPGKAVMGLRVMKLDGTRMNWKTSISRSLLVWLTGLAMGLPIQPLVLMLQYFFFLREGVASWDRKLGLEVQYRTLNPLRLVLVSIVMFVILILLFLASKDVPKGS